MALGKVIGGKSGTSYRRFEVLEPPPKPPRRPKNRPYSDTPNCQHGIIPSQCDECHPGPESLARIYAWRASLPVKERTYYPPPVPPQAFVPSGGSSEAAGPSGCTCPKCPANKGGPCRCGRFWHDKDRRPHCGMHDPNPAGDPTRPKRMRWRD